MIDEEEIVFDRELAKNRHKELMALVKAIPTEKVKIEPDEKTSQAIEGFAELLKNIKVEAKAPDVIVNQEEVINQLNEVGKKILKALEDLKPTNEIEKPKEWVFSIKRNSWSNLIESITAKAK